MAHINYFGLKNFRVFEDLHRFDLRPITILVGTNSSGKSSFSKGILLLKEAFEKVISQNKYISMWDLETLNFAPYLNLGNFEYCINNKSNNEAITFELPMRLPMLEDLFCFQLTYQKANNALKRGSLKEVKIIHLDSQTEILCHNAETGFLTIKFSYLREKLDEATIKINEINKIEKQIETLNKPFWKKSGPFGGFSLNQDDIPLDVKEQIEQLSNRGLEISPSYNNRIASQNYDTDGFNPYITIHFNYLYLKSYDPNLPLLNYFFLFDDKYLKEQLQKFQLSDDAFLNLKIKETNILSDLEKKDANIFSYLKNIENKSLDEINIKNLHSIDNDTSFNGTWQELNSFDSINKLFFTQLIENENILDDVLNISQAKLWELQYFPLLLKPVDEVIPNNFESFIKEYIYKGIGDSITTISSIYKSIDYIPSVRAKVDRVFNNDTNSFIKEVLNELHSIRLSIAAQNFINKALQDFGIADEILINLSDDSSFSKIYLLKNGIKQELADIGYGVAQILPIILKIGLLIEKSCSEYGPSYHTASTLIIEEPETNLHPALQSKLADMFVECYQKYNIQFIVETHSEYLIRKLQYLTAKGEFSAKDSNIYYFNDPNNIPAGEPQVKKIEILEDGSLSDDFGSGFFDEADNLAINLFNLQNRKN